MFRLAPDSGDCAFAKKCLNEGTFEGTTDVTVISNLIKVWFRELPPNLLNCVGEDFLVEVGNTDDVRFPSSCNVCSAFFIYTLSS